MIDFLAPTFDSSVIGPNGRLSRLHKGPEGPKDPTKQQLELEKTQLDFTKSQLAELERQRSMPITQAPKPLAPLPPPTNQSSADSEQAAAAARRQSLRRKAPGRSTIFAGESAGAIGGQKTILG